MYITVGVCNLRAASQVMTKVSNVVIMMFSPFQFKLISFGVKDFLC